VINVNKPYIVQPYFQPGSLKAYLSVAAILAISTLLRLTLRPLIDVLPWVGGLPYIGAFPAVILATFLCGSVAGLLTTFLSIVSVWLLIDPDTTTSVLVYQTGLFSVGALTVVGVIGAMRSATADIQQLNATLRVSEEKLREANKAKSDFLANVSHELRTPLNAIIGFSELIRDATAGPLDNTYRDYGSDINESGRHLQNIINDILDISKIEHGRLELRNDVVSITDTIETCRRIIDPMALGAGVALTVDSAAQLPLIHSDQIRLQQILLNLMSNAVKFTPSGGRVTVSAAISESAVVIAVEDTGIGMKAEDIAIALEPFRQIDGALSRRYAGTGLGLPLAKALVELHGGTLDIKSAPGIGTTVCIRFPTARIIDAAA